MKKKKNIIREERNIKYFHRFTSAANKYSSAGHHEQKNEKTTGQIKFSAVIIRQQIKLVLQHSLHKKNVNVKCCRCTGSLCSIPCLVK